MRRQAAGAIALAAAVAGWPSPPALPAAAPSGQAPKTAVERVGLPAVLLRETPALLESEPGGWTSVQPGRDLAGWTR